MTISRSLKNYTPHHSPKPPHQKGSGFLKTLADIIRRRKLSKEQWKRFLSTVLVFGVGAILAGIFSFIALVAWFAKDIPNPNHLQDRNIAETTKIYDRTGEVVLYEIHGDQKRTSVELTDISPHALHATVAIEDKNFYLHHGFSLKGYLRAFISNFITRDRGQGGSTITQQFVKNAILTNEKTYTRKLKELILSLEIERRFTKDEILKLYLNEIPYGSVLYGIEAASQAFLGKPAKDLTISEAAFIAAIPQSPTYYSPYGNHRDELVVRQHTVIRAMLNQGYISQEEADTALADDVLARVKPKRENSIAQHFVFMVQEELAKMYGDQSVERGGLKVTTTLDAKLQTFANESIDKFVPGLAKWNASNAALLSIDPKEGDILAMVGSADYNNNDIDGKFNIWTKGYRQPGSSIKPIIYTAAFEKGYTPDTVLNDVNTTFKNLPDDYTPKNYDLKERGPITIKEALAGSLNIPAVQAYYLTGTQRTLDLTNRLGYTTFDPKNMGLSFALGGNEVRPLEHINAFSALAQEGQLPQLVSILEVKDKTGKVIYKAEHSKKQVIDPEITRLTNGIMSNNDLRAYIFGTRNYLTLPDRPVAAKTGTTNDNRDAWTVGYTPSLVTGVWVGNSKGAMKAGADGSIVAAPIWNDYMRKATKDKPVENFTSAQPIVTGKPILDGNKDVRQTYTIDAISGKLATDATPEQFRIQKTFGPPHSILFFVDKDNPRGPTPEHPESDPQFQNWETAILDWAMRQGMIIEPPPTESDTIHDSAAAPQVSMQQPRENQAITSRGIDVQYTASGTRPITKVEFLLDDTIISTKTSAPFDGSTRVAIPGITSQGFHRFTIRAYDEVGNVGTAWITLNIQIAASQTGIDWLSPVPDDILTGSSFPVAIRFKMPVEGVKRVQITLAKPSGEKTTLATITKPTISNFSFIWSNTDEFGRHTISVKVDYDDGRTETDEINIEVK